MFAAAARRGVVKALAHGRAAYATAHPDLPKVQDPQQALGRLASEWVAGWGRKGAAGAMHTTGSMQQRPMQSADADQLQCT